MAMTGKATDEKLKVFVSYSRSDVDFANQLVAVLKPASKRPSGSQTGAVCTNDLQATRSILPFICS